MPRGQVKQVFGKNMRTSKTGGFEHKKDAQRKPINVFTTKLRSQTKLIAKSNERQVAVQTKDA